MPPAVKPSQSGLIGTLASRFTFGFVAGRPLKLSIRMSASLFGERLLRVGSGCSDDEEAAVPEAEGRLTVTLPPDTEQLTNGRSGREAAEITSRVGA